ncbi:MAG: hypothetical protein LIO46_01345 [Clostridiales bacterium]|nr:hypothetical protein [Clostridiales bacterium]
MGALVTADVTDEASLRAAVADASVEVIRLMNDIAIANVLSVNRDLILMSGTGSEVVLGVSGSSRHFSISNAEVTLWFDNVVLSGSNNSGGGIQASDSVLTLNNARVTSCRSYALETLNCDVVLYQCEFWENSGSAVYMTVSQVLYGDSEIQNRTAELYHVNVHDNGRNSAAGSRGGGMTLAYMNVHFFSGNVEGNQAEAGGGMYVEGGKLNLYDVAVRGNSATSGGGIAVFGGFSMTEETEICFNSASDTGGGLVFVVDGQTWFDCGLREGLSNTLADLVVLLKVLVTDFTDVFGYEISAGKIYGNEAGIGGGIMGYNVVLSGGEIYENEAILGGGVSSYVAWITDGADIHDNDAKFAGGLGVLSLQMEGGHFHDNYAEVGGGIGSFGLQIEMFAALLNVLDGDEDITEFLLTYFPALFPPSNISGGVIEGNTAEAYAGGVGSMGNLLISGGIIRENSVLDKEGYGGGIGALYLNEEWTETIETALQGINWDFLFNGQLTFPSVIVSNTLIVTGGEIYDNSAFAGGGIATGFIDADNNSMKWDANLLLGGASVYGNTAEGGGGLAVFGDEELPSIVVLKDTKIYENIGIGIGGGIYNAGYLCVKDAEIIGNGTEYVGGGIANRGELITLGAPEISGNIAGESGGGVYNEGYADLDGAHITENHADEYGGGIYSFTTDLIYSKDLVLGNTAGVAGQNVYIEGQEPDDGVETFAQLKAALDAGQAEIVILNDIVFEDTLIIGSDVTLKADGAVTLTSAAEKRHFTVSGADVTVSFENVSLNGNGNGGGIESAAGSLTLAGARILSCAAEHGGAVEAGGNLVIEGGQYTLNRAADGGAVWAGGTLALRGGATFVSNSASGSGGAVYGARRSVIDLQSATIAQNTAAEYGGGIASYGTVNELGGTVLGNTAGADGNDIWIGTWQITTYAELKEALADPSETELYIGNDIVLEDTLAISRDVTLKADGAVTLTSAAGKRHFTVSGGSITVAFDNVSLNGSGSGGGIESTAGSLTLENPRILSCAAENGGAVEAGGNLVIEGGQFTLNTAACGGAIYVDKTLTLQGGATLISNWAAAFGGAVYGGPDSEINLVSTTIAQNSTDGYGGGVASYGAVNELGGTVLGNTAGIEGDDIWIGTLYAVVTNYEELKAALADPDADVIAIANDFTFAGTLTIERDVLILGLDGTKTLTSANARHFVLAGNGIAVAFEDVILDGNGQAGGIESSAADATLAGAQIQNCQTSGNGGALYAAGSLTVENGVFTGNSAGTGGAVYGAPDSVLTLNETRISGNTASVFGGGAATEGTLYISGGSVTNNTAAALGGGLFGYAFSVMYFSADTVTGNSPDEYYSLGSVVLQ